MRVAVSCRRLFYGSELLKLPNTIQQVGPGIYVYCIEFQIRPQIPNHWPCLFIYCVFYLFVTPIIPNPPHALSDTKIVSDGGGQGHDLFSPWSGHINFAHTNILKNGPPENQKQVSAKCSRKCIKTVWMTKWLNTMQCTSYNNIWLVGWKLGAYLRTKMYRLV